MPGLVRGMLGERDAPSIRAAVTNGAATISRTTFAVDVLALVVVSLSLDVLMLFVFGVPGLWEDRLAVSLHLRQELPGSHELGDGEVAMCGHQSARGGEEGRRPLHCVVVYIYYDVTGA